MCACQHFVFVEILIDLRQAEGICSVSKANMARNVAAVPIATKMVTYGLCQTIKVAFACLQFVSLLRFIGRCTWIHKDSAAAIDVDTSF